jgi:hypothetical protein
VFLAAALVAACAALTGGCSGGGSAHDATPAPTSTAQATPGRVHVDVADVDLTITDAVAHLDRAGDGTLAMRIRNDNGVPEHLAMVATPGGERGVLYGGGSAEGNGSLSTAGILLRTGTTVAFGSGGGPHVALHHVHGVSAQHTLPLTMQFGVAGLVHFQARVASSG